MSSNIYDVVNVITNAIVTQ